MAQVRGTIHGKVIQLADDTGLPDGLEVTVIVLPAPTRESLEPMPPGEGILRSAGAWAEDAAELDQYLEWSRSQRKRRRSEGGL